jgi:hypothetical protein
VNPAPLTAVRIEEGQRAHLKLELLHPARVAHVAAPAASIEYENIDV